MLPICKHNIIRYADSLQIGNISSISDKLENLNSHFLKGTSRLPLNDIKSLYNYLLLWKKR
jgi:hypothetical protein